MLVLLKLSRLGLKRHTGFVTLNRTSGEDIEKKTQMSMSGPPGDEKNKVNQGT